MRAEINEKENQQQRKIHETKASYLEKSIKLINPKLIKKKKDIKYQYQ